MCTYLPVTKQNISFHFKKNRHLLLLLGIITIGILLRVYKLGDLGLTENEDYVANAVRGVLDTWLPIYPSGALYPRALPLTYLTSLSAYIFGYDDFTLRIPNTIFSILSIVVGYLLTARLFGIRVALIAAGLIAFSDWEILLGRTARMYGTLSFFLLLSMWLLDKAIMEGGRITKHLTFLSIIIACLVQELAIILLPFYFFYFLFRQPRGKKLRLLLICALVTIFAFATNTFIKRHFYSQAFAIEASLIANQKIKSTDEKQAEALFQKPEKNILNKIINSTPVTLLSKKHLLVFLQAQKHHPVTTLILITGLTSLILFYGIRTFRRSDSPIYTAAIFTILIPLCLQQIMLALLIVLLYTLLARTFEPNTYIKRSYTLLIICSIAAISWIFLGTTSLQGSPLENLYASTMMLLSFPMSFFTLYATPYPFLTACAVISAALALKHYLVNGRVNEIGYITLLFTGTILLMGFHPLSLSRPFPRYVAFLNPYFLIMVAFIIDMAVKKLSQIKNHRTNKVKITIIVAFTCLSAILITRETAYSSWHMITTKYGENNLSASVAGYVRDFYPDQRTPALFVKNHAKPNDIIIAMDVLGFYVYFPRIDFQLRVTGGTDAERWLGQQTLFSKKELVKILKQYHNHNIWIILEGKMLKQYAGNHDWSNILDLIVSQSGSPRYIGLDKLSRVYMITQHNQ